MDQTSKSRNNRRIIEAEKRTQEVRSFKEAIIAILPKDFQMVLQAIVTMACLYEFIQSKDAVWIMTAYAMANGASNLPIVKTLLPSHKGSSRNETDEPRL
jgi:hypothetical protein